MSVGRTSRPKGEPAKPEHRDAAFRTPDSAGRPSNLAARTRGSDLRSTPPGPPRSSEIRDSTSTPPQPWYAGGLRFTCTQCGRCCGGAPGYVWVTPAEIAAIARELGLSVERFEQLHVREVGVRRSLLERRNGDCEFLRRDDGGKAFCSIYSVRPRQCRTWPFWHGNLDTPQAWAEAGQTCPGINKGQHRPLPVIEAALKR